jgi:integrase
MRETLMPKQASNKEKAPRGEARRFTFTDISLRRLKPSERQYLVWDKPNERQVGQLGLSVLVSPGGTKTFRATYYVDGKTVSKKLGRVGEMPLGTARQRAAALRGQADAGIDPKEEERRTRAAREAEAARERTYEEAVEQFIELYAKPRQRTWKQTKRVLLGGSDHRGSGGEDRRENPWLARPINSITKTDAYSLLEGFIASGHGYKARLTLAWLRTLWRWAYKRDLVQGPIMDAVEIHFESEEPRTPITKGGKEKRRKTPYSDDEIRAIWRAAERLSPVRQAYVKLLLLLGPRKGSRDDGRVTGGLSTMRIEHLELDGDGPVWTVPSDITKQFRKSKPKKAKPYLIPLPPLARRIIKSILPKEGAASGWVFPGARGAPLSPTGKLTKQLVAVGAPADFNYHCVRHTMETWFQVEGYDPYDLKLVLNHTTTSGATTNYAHGYALERKRKLMETWADYVEGLVMPQGVKALR